MRMTGDVKCYHCGHVSGQVEGNRTGERLVFHTFTPREGFQGRIPGSGDSVRCERCGGPIFLEDLRPTPTNPVSIPMPSARKKRSAPKKAA